MATSSFEPEAAPENTPPLRRGTRKRIRTQKVRDMLPVATPHTVESEETAPVPRHRVTLHVREHFRTLANKFGLARLYKGKPSRVPDEELDIGSTFIPTKATNAIHQKRSLAEILNPYPNLSAFLFDHRFWTSGGKDSRQARDEAKAIHGRPDYIPQDIFNANLDKVEETLRARSKAAQWDNEDGWHETPITIGIPLGEKSSTTARRIDSTHNSRVHRHEAFENDPAEHEIVGQHFSIPGFHHRSICSIIKETFATDPAAHDFHYNPFELFHFSTGKPPERVHGELYTSDCWLEADAKLQFSPREPECELPRAIAAMMIWSDATHLSQFGNAKAWPIYMFFGNQSKYARCQPSAYGAHHLGYLPSVSNQTNFYILILMLQQKLPDNLQDKIRAALGKAASKPVLTHCRREIFQSAWKILLDDPEFMHAYHHGIVVDCADGVRRRLYPRLFTYSADYPEKYEAQTRVCFSS